MTERPEEREPTGSDDLLEQAWRQISESRGTGAESGPSEEGQSDALLSETWTWLESPTEPEAGTAPRTRGREAEAERPALRPRPERPLRADAPTPPVGPAPRRPEPPPVPRPVPSPADTTGARRAAMLAGLSLVSVLGIGVAVLLAATATTRSAPRSTAVTSVAVSTTSAAGTRAPGSTEPLVIVVESSGTASAVNPCTAETIEGSVVAGIDYRESDGGGASVSIVVTGDDLEGSEGNRYSMRLRASGRFESASGELSMPAESLTWSWGERQRFTEQALVVVRVTGGKLTGWSFESSEGVCDVVACPEALQPTCDPWTATTAALITAAFTGTDPLGPDPLLLDDGLYRRHDIVTSVPEGATIEWGLASDPADVSSGAITTQDSDRDRLVTVTWMPAARPATDADLTVAIDHTLNEIAAEDGTVPRRGPAETWSLGDSRFIYRTVGAQLAGTEISGALGARYCPASGRVVIVSSWLRGAVSPDRAATDLLPLVTTLEC